MCESGTKGAPESKGKCVHRSGTNGTGVCEPVSSATHVFDVASRTWALPFVERVGKWPSVKERRVFRRLLRCMRAPDAADRPTFASALAFLDDLDETYGVE